MATRVDDRQAAALRIQDFEAPEPQPELPIDRVVARVREDARQDSSRYLRETVVPEGGE